MTAVAQWAKAPNIRYCVAGSNPPSHPDSVLMKNAHRSTTKKLSALRTSLEYSLLKHRAQIPSKKRSLGICPVFQNQFNPYLLKKQNKGKTTYIKPVLRTRICIQFAPWIPIQLLKHKRLKPKFTTINKVFREKNLIFQYVFPLGHNMHTITYGTNGISILN